MTKDHKQLGTYKIKKLTKMSENVYKKLEYFPLGFEPFLILCTVGTKPQPFLTSKQSEKNL